MGGQAAVFVYTFWAMFFTALSVKHFFFPERDPVISRLQKVGRVSSHAGEGRLSVAKAAKASPGIQRIREKLLLAGLKRGSDLSNFLLFQRICLAMPFFTGVLFSLFLHATPEVAVLAAVGAGVVFIIMPRAWLIWATAKRRAEIKRYLPDTLDLFVIALEAGLSFDSALIRVAEEQRRVSTHISREFLYTNQELLVGKSREEALRGLSRRCRLDEMDSVIRSVIQSNKLGTGLVKTLRTQAETLRKKRKQDVHAMILKAPVKLIFPLLFLIFPTLLLVILGPSMIEILRWINVEELVVSSRGGGV